MTSMHQKDFTNLIKDPEFEKNLMKNCFECNQECCKSVIVEIDEPTTKRDWEDIRWKVAHKNVQVILDNEDDWCIEFVTDCDQMDEQGRCKIYEKRPDMCSSHDPDDCIVNGDGEYYKLIFKNVKEVEEYLARHPEAIKEQEPELTKCPKCGHEWEETTEE
mgnify:CR=1 FL=1